MASPFFQAPVPSPTLTQAGNRRHLFIAGHHGLNAGLANKYEAFVIWQEEGDGAVWIQPPLSSFSWPPGLAPLVEIGSRPGRPGT
jgi:hypothetical protein